MTRITKTIGIMLSAALLSSCCELSNSMSSCHKPACKTGGSAEEFLDEPWLCRIPKDKRAWARDADSWFLTGLPNKIEQCDLKAPSEKAMSLVQVRTPPFVNINVRGNFQVQIEGGKSCNSVDILGPNDAIRLTAVDFFNNTAFIHEVKDCDPKVCTPARMERVIVRIGIHDLHTLVNKGSGDVYGRNIASDCLAVFSHGSGDTMLNGLMNIKRIKQTGSGTVTVFGAYTPTLDMKVLGPGDVNVSGRVGIRSIIHQGNGYVNIIGADTDTLRISAAGTGTTAINGFVNLKKIVAVDNSKVYIYWVNSDNTTVIEKDRARVGLAGITQNLNVDARGSSIFWGRYLRGNHIYTRTDDQAHANVSANGKLFASAAGNSSIYFFGSPGNVSRFTSHHGEIMQINDDQQLPAPTRPLPWNSPRSYKDAGWVSPSAGQSVFK